MNDDDKAFSQFLFAMYITIIGIFLLYLNHGETIIYYSSLMYCMAVEKFHIIIESIHSLFYQ